MGKVIGGIFSVIALGAIIFIIGSKLGWFNLSLRGGNGDGDGSGTAASASDSIPAQSNSSDVSENDKVSEIRIERNEIFFDDEPCKNIDDLEQQIIKIGTDHEYTFVYDNALKGTYDEVWAMLSDLKDALGITVNPQ